MAANFWGSSQYAHLISKSLLRNTNPEDKSRGLTERQVQQIKVHFYALITEVARHAKLRQRVAATAITYFRRFYLRNSFYKFDPRLVAPCCLYVASKCEESILAAKHLVIYMKKVRPSWSYELQRLLEYEMVVLEELDYNLVLYDPYGPLQDYLADPKLIELSRHAWSALNDSYRTDISLVYPPYLIALGCICFAACYSNKDISSWLAEIQVDLNHVYDIAAELNNMYTEFGSVLSVEECYQLLDASR